MKKKKKLNIVLIVTLSVGVTVMMGLGIYFSIQKLIHPHFEVIRKNGDWRTYQVALPDDSTYLSQEDKKRFQKKIYFDLPSRYKLIEVPCTGSDSGCIYSATLLTDLAPWAPEAGIFIGKGYEKYTIGGQVSTIHYDSKSRKWVLSTSSESGPIVTELKKFGETRSSADVYVGSNGGSHGSTTYYIIEDVAHEYLTVLSFRNSLRVRCEYQKFDCYEWLKDKDGGEGDAGWLSEDYMKKVFSEKEDIVKSVIMSF